MWLGYIFKSTTPVKIFKRIYRYFRRFTLIRTVILVASYILTFLGTGVAFLAVSAVFLVIMPIMALLCIILVFASLIDRKKICRQMSVYLENKDIFVFFATRGDNFGKGSFFAGNCFDLASKENSAVIIVSPFYISPRGICKKRFFFSVKEESKNIYIVRKYTFFYLRKHVIEHTDRQTVYFY